MSGIFGRLNVGFKYLSRPDNGEKSMFTVVPPSLPRFCTEIFTHHQKELVSAFTKLLNSLSSVVPEIKRYRVGWRTFRLRIKMYSERLLMSNTEELLCVVHNVAATKESSASKTPELASELVRTSRCSSGRVFSVLPCPRDV